MSTVRRWDALTREEIAELAPDALLVLPVGTTEQHGPHLATCTDALIATVVAERAAAAASRPETILLAPTLAYGASDHHLPFGGTLSLGVDTFELVLADLLSSAAAAGVRRVFVLNAHGGNAAACAVAVAEASREHGLIAGTALTRQPRRRERPRRHLGDLGRSRTRPGPRADGSCDPLARWPGADASAAASSSPSRAAGRSSTATPTRPNEATAEFGEQALADCVAAAAAAFEHLADIGG